MVTQHGDAPAAIPIAGLGRRLLSLVYEALLLTALLFAGSLPVVMLSEHLPQYGQRALLQGYILLLCGWFYVWQWTRGGQTLPMKAWHLRLVALDGSRIGTRRAVVRYLAAFVGTLALGAGFLWAALDRDRQFLHDRLAGTRVIRIDV